MRISDWSSDVCSSDLHEKRTEQLGWAQRIAWRCATQREEDAHVGSTDSEFGPAVLVVDCLQYASNSIGVDKVEIIGRIEIRALVLQRFSDMSGVAAVMGHPRSRHRNSLPSAFEASIGRWYRKSKLWKKMDAVPSTTRRTRSISAPQS